MLLPEDDPIVLAPESDAEPMVLGLDEAPAVLPRLGQGDVLPALEEPMLPVVEPVLDPMLESVPVLAPGVVVEPLEEVCACTANEATASAALAARTASLWVLVMSEVLWLNHVRTKVRPVPAASQEVSGNRSRERGPWRGAMGRVPTWRRQCACPVKATRRWAAPQAVARQAADR